jgi:hypothetical protein
MKLKKSFVVAAIFVMIITGAVLFASPSTFTKIVESFRSPGNEPVVVEMAHPAPTVSYVDSFHFLEPLAPRAGDPAKFDPSLLTYLQVGVCEVTAVDCIPVKTFTAQGSMSERIRTERGGGWTYYIVNWDTQRVNLGDKTYRIEVNAAGIPLGSVDLTPDVYRTFGRTWPIKFLIERDPELHIRILSATGNTIWDVADILRSDFGICDDELSQLLLSTYPNATPVQVEMVVRNVCQDVTLAPNTKIADNVTRAALGSFDVNSGRMVFLLETPLLKNLRTSDVLVGKPSSAAPFGYLRKVTSIRKDRGIYYVDTLQASLTEAIYKGKLDASGEMLPEDELPAEPSAANSVRMFSKTEPGAAQLSDSLTSGCSESSGSTGYNFECSVDETFDINRGVGEFEGTGHVRVAGKVYFNAGYDVGVGIELCARVPPVCMDRFEARLRVKQKSELHIDGTLDARLFKEIVVARKIFDPITFWIGPVPVVIFPVANLVVGARGDAHVAFDFDATAESNFAIGAKWTDQSDGGQGWEDVSEAIVNGTADGSLEGSLDLRTYYKGNAKLLLYGVAGPSFGGALGGRARFQIPAPAGQPVWSIYGRVDGDIAFEVSIIDVISLTRFSLEEFRVQEIELKRSPNFVPRCTAREFPVNINISATVRLGPTSQGGSGYFDCTDPEGDAINYSFVSNYPTSDTIFQSTNSVRFGLPIDAVHTITVQATDANGGAAPPFTLAFFVVNPPPEVFVKKATDTVPVGVQYFVNALAYDPDRGEYLDCIRESPTGQQTRFDFFVNAPNTVRKIGDGFNCSAEVIFHQTGPQQIKVVAIDYLGATGESFVNVNVTAAPSNSAPVIDVSSISFQAIATRNFQLRAGATIYTCLTGQICSIPNGADVAGGINSYPARYQLPFYMSLSASDADGTTPTTTWYCSDSFDNVSLATHVGGSVFSCSAFGPARNVFIGATVSDGVTTVFSEIRTYRMMPLSNPN